MLLFAIGCGGGPTPAAEEGNDQTVLLRQRAAPGERYALRLTTLVSHHDGRRLTTIIEGETSIDHVDASGTASVATRIAGARMLFPSNPVGLPARDLGLAGARGFGQFDAYGAPVGDLNIEGGDRPPGPLAETIQQLAGPARYPQDAVTTGTRFRAPFHWPASLAGLASSGRGDLEYVVEDIRRVDGAAQPSIRVRGVQVLDPIERGGEPIGVEASIVAVLVITTEGANTARASGLVDFEYQLPSDRNQNALYRLPTQLAFEWCRYPAGTDPESAGCDEPSSVRSVERPQERIANDYTGEACLGRLAAWRGRLANTPRPAHLPPLLVDLPVVPTAPLAAVPGVRLQQLPTGVFDAYGARLGSRELHDFLMRERSAWLPEDYGGAAPTVFLAFPSEAPVALLVALLDQIPDEFEVHLLVSSQSPPTPPAATPDTAPTWLVERVQAIQRLPATSDQRARAVAELGLDAVGTCPPAIVSVGGALHANPEGRWLTMRDLPNDVEGCRCEGVDVDALDAMTSLIRGEALPPSTLLLRAPATTGRRLRLRRGADVGALSTALARRPSRSGVVFSP